MPGTLRAQADFRSWRTSRPSTDPDACRLSGACAIYCPEGAQFIANGYMDTDLSLCKGCGICAQECPTGAITMVAEPLEEAAP